MKRDYNTIIMKLNPALDALNRPLNDLRISVTDKCNFRCTYCMPKEIFTTDFKFLDRKDLLSFDEISRISLIFKSLGVKKIRITGGEPLLRKELSVLIGKLNEHAFDDVTLTTNATLLKKRARILKDSGLKRITVSLDSLDDKIFRAMNDVDAPVKRVLDGIDEANSVGLNPIKINMVVKKGFNENSVLPMCKYFKNSGHILRFIEFMDVGTTNGWNMKNVVPSKDLINMINKIYPIIPIESNYKGEVAKRWRYAEGGGEIGFISSVTEAFCSTCSRARISAEGKLYTCLFANKGVDLRYFIREGATDEEIRQKIIDTWNNRNDRYSEIRHLNTENLPKVEMSYIGG